MPIVVKSPNESFGRGLRSFGKSLEGIGEKFGEKKRKQEQEQRDDLRRRTSREEQMTERTVERGVIAEENIAKNEKVGTAVNAKIAQLNALKDSGQEVSDMDRLNGMIEVQQETGIPMSEVMSYYKAYQNAEANMDKKSKAGEAKVERDILRDQRAFEYTNKMRPELVGEDREVFDEMSQKYSNIADPRKRYNLANKEYKRLERLYSNFENLVKSPTFGERVLGISDASEKTMQNNVKAVLNAGGREEKLVDMFTAQNFDEVEIERFIAPLSTGKNGEVEAIARIPKAISSSQGIYSANQSVLRGQQRDKQIERLPELIVPALKDGGSVRLLSEALVNKGYTRADVHKALTDVLKEVSLTPRQEKAIIKLSEKPRSRSMMENLTGSSSGRSPENLANTMRI